MKQSLSAPGGAPIKKVGHTQGPAYGTNPNLKARGQAGAEATEISFGK